MGDSDSEIEFNLDENAHEDLHEEVANENQNGQGQGGARLFWIGPLDRLFVGLQIHARYAIRLRNAGSHLTGIHIETMTRSGLL